MGGGDLNLKKSWHPSTLRNIERVWKAEQKHEAEQQKIEQLQKELAAERAREEMHAYAEDQGVVKKRDERLDWMYQGPAALVNREDYLLGRKIDKTFEILQMQENGQSVEKEENRHVGSVFRPDASTSNVTVDLATKIREDPLFAIMKREKEQRKNLLNNPVRMKQLKQMLEQSLVKKDKKSKKINKKKGKRARSESSSSSSSESSDHEESAKYKKRKSDEYEEKHSRDKKKEKSSRDDKYGNTRSNKYEEHKTNADRKSRHRDSRSSQHEEKSFTSSKDRNYKSDMKEHKDYYYSKEHRKTYSDHYNSKYDQKDSKYERKDSKYDQKHDHKKKLSSEEMERKRREMMDNAKWRENQRHKNVERYVKEAEQEDNVGKGSASTFIRPLLSKAAEHGSVEGRVKQKIFTIQRKRGDMDSNFARR